MFQRNLDACGVHYSALRRQRLLSLTAETQLRTDEIATEAHFGFDTRLKSLSGLNIQFPQEAVQLAPPDH